ncbi:MAG: helix-turn-helix transcriptional regulator [Lachnospiraceae bacterium]|nr:helix-turn-helix transcriptional regulator [Lachnospiraceae bacterium]
MKIYSAKDFGAEIRRRRKALGYTQKALSEFTGYSISFISDLENGKATIEFEKALKLANLLGLDLDVSARA